MFERDQQTRPEETPLLQPESSFRGLTLEDIEVHIRIRRYGDFMLTEAVSPSYDIQIRPEEGYRLECYVNPDSGKSIPVAVAAVSAPKLMGMLEGVLQKFSEAGCETVNVEIFSSRPEGDDRGGAWKREDIDIPVLASALEEYQELLLNDGLSGIAICSQQLEFELVFDEHKLFAFYGNPLLAQEILREHGIELKPEMQFLTEAEHIHNSRTEFGDQFARLAQVIAG